MNDDREPTSDPEATALGPVPPEFDRDDTKARRRRAESQVGELGTQLRDIRLELARAAGAASVWRVVGGIAGSVAILLGGAALTLAANASADHERVARHDEVIEALREDVTAIRVDVSAVRARVENQRADRNFRFIEREDPHE